MLQIVLTLVLFGGILTLSIALIRFQLRKGEVLLQQWAETNRYDLLDHERANPPGTGPMSQYTKNAQLIYRVSVRDEAGCVRQGTVRVGSRSVGALSDEVSVTWD